MNDRALMRSQTGTAGSRAAKTRELCRPPGMGASGIAILLGTGGSQRSA